jgi:hypothetical protein
MKKNLTILLIIAAAILAGCGVHVKTSPAEALSPQAHLFMTTPTSSLEKGEQSEAVAHTVSTPLSMLGYPTTLPTYLVPSRLITLTYAPTQVVTSVPTQITPTSIAPTAVPTQPGATLVPTSIPATATAEAVYPYIVQPGSPALVPNFVNPTAGCSWQGIAGQVFDADGTAVKNLVVKVGGVWNGTTINLLGMTGTAPAYGEGGFEVVLGTKAVNSTNTVWVQIFDLSNKAVSDKVNVSTSSDCSKNLTLINFKEAVPGYELFAPLVVPTIEP